MEHFFETRDEASIAAAEQIASALQRRLDLKRVASLVVSGGTTPSRCFQELAQTDLNWSGINVLASDDRWVPPDHEDSNEKLIRETLLVERATEADFLPFYSPDNSIEERCTDLDSDIRLVPFPFACALLGMGADGHFASLFPDASNLATGLDIDSQSLCMPVKTDASPYARVSLTLSALSRSDEVVLLFFGDDKREVYEAAKLDGDRYPVSRLLRQKRAPVHTYWAP